MDVRASARYVRVAPNKARQVVGHIRGLDVEQARNVLLLEPKGAGRYVQKVLESAIANAENNHDLDPDDLVVTSAVVDEGPTLKRFQPRAMGRAYRIRKRTSHITIVIGTSRSLAPRNTRNTRRTGSAGRKTEE
jgi:large subunit ribosomal protein L22